LRAIERQHHTALAVTPVTAKRVDDATRSAAMTIWTRARCAAFQLLRTWVGLVAALLVLPLQASPVMVDINGRATAPALVYSDASIGWSIKPGQDMLLDGLYSTFGKVSATTNLGPVQPRRVQVSVYDGGPQGALKARTSFMVDANGGALGSEIEPVLLRGGRAYFVAFENLRNIGVNIADWQVQQFYPVFNLDAWYSGVDLATSNPGYSNGALQPLSAPILRLQGTPVTNLSQVDCLLTWAERTYPGVFAPRSPPSQTLYTFYYRYYAQTNAYLGISAADMHVYVLDGNSGIITDAGALQNWLVAANCLPKR
jgi:hypothetical protein